MSTVLTPTLYDPLYVNSGASGKGSPIKNASEEKNINGIDNKMRIKIFFIKKPPII